MFPGFLTLVVLQLSFQSYRLLFSHALREVRGENMSERKFASTGYRTYNHQATSQTRSPMSHPGWVNAYLHSHMRTCHVRTSTRAYMPRTYKHTCEHKLYIAISTYVPTELRMYMYTQVHVRRYAHTYLHTFIRKCEYKRSYIYVYIHI